MKKLLLSFAVSTSAACSSFAQNNWCHTYEMSDASLSANPGLKIQRAHLEAFTRNYEDASKGNGSVVFKIPVVFHIIHNYGTENISKAQVLDAVQIINKDFQKLNSDTGLVIAAFQGIYANCEIEFRLAQLDPNGNCTDGITRTVSDLTFTANDNVKNLISWNTSKYLNIWVVNNIASGAGGYSYLPGSAPQASYDGIVALHSQTGSIGSSCGSNLCARTLTHEIGHYLNLHHVWGPGNTPGDPNNCSIDDFVGDTPNCIGVANQNCNVNQNTCGSLDNVQNYMEYSSCPKMFTNGQKTRMHACLNSGVASRNNLWDAANLIATGTNDNYSAPPCVPIADFNSAKKYICEGTTVTFYDNSWKADVTSWSWSFPGGNPSSSTQQNPSVQYSTAGVYDVTLVVSNASGIDTLARTALVYVSPAVTTTSPPLTEDFESITFPNSYDWILENQGITNAWHLSTVASVSGSQCMRLVNHSGNANGNKDAFITPSYNFDNYSNVQMTFQLAFAHRSSSTTDKLQVFTSTSCGQSWAVRYTKSGTALSTAGLISQPFTPTAAQWRLETVNLSTTSVSGQPRVRFKFEYTQNTGNNIYIDDINITGTVGIAQPAVLLPGFSVNPNPANENSEITFTLYREKRTGIIITDLAGRTLFNLADEMLPAGDYRFKIGKKLSEGVYFVTISIDGLKYTSKIVFTE